MEKLVGQKVQPGHNPLVICHTIITPEVLEELDDLCDLDVKMRVIGYVKEKSSSAIEAKAVRSIHAIFLLLLWLIPCCYSCLLRWTTFTLPQKTRFLWLLSTSLPLLEALRHWKK